MEIPPEELRPARESKGGGAPGLARDTNGGGAPTAPPAGLASFVESRLFITTESRAGGGGAIAETTTGATALRAAAAISKRSFSFLFALSPPPAALGEVAADFEKPAFEDLGDAPCAEGDGSSDIPILEGTGLCSPHISAVSAWLLVSPTPAAAPPASVAASEASESGGGSSA